MDLSSFSFKGSYNRIDDDIAEEFYLPCMRNSLRYDRISGYFGSTIYLIAWDALREMINNNGRIRIICSPVLSEEDQNALSEGSAAKADSILSEALDDELQEMLSDDNLKLPARLLTCLIANGIVELKVALVTENGHPSIRSLFHDKTGIFDDGSGHLVGFRGSFNETFKGLSNDGNIESVDVFQSWDGGKDLQRIESVEVLFDRIWANSVPDSVRVWDIPDAIHDSIFKQASKYDIDKLLEEIKVTSSRANKWKPNPKGRTPREHQAKALDNWVANGRRGVLKHATGSGKSFTAICAINDALKKHETVLLLVPSKELLHQWKTDLEKSMAGKEISFLLCGDGNDSWRRENELYKWTTPNDTINKIIIAIMATAANPDFINGVNSGSHLFVVADEVHNLGSKKRRNIFNIVSGPRLGLSATPERFGDEEGTNAIFSYFGDIIQPEFSLEDAIKSHVLTRYFYHPNRVYLNEIEQESWDAIAKEIAKLIARSNSAGQSLSDSIKNNPRLQQLLIDRARILKNASNKVKLAIKILDENFKPGQKWIVYCDNQSQLRQVLIAAEEHGFDAYEYYAEMEGDREETLKYFESFGGVLVSIKCLDEGVDIPSTTHALILASSKNPREYIQRRGRVLRLSEGKSFAHVYDAITLPNGAIEENDRQTSIVIGELSRAIQFGTWAENEGCITDLKIIAIDYGIDYQDYVKGGFEDDENE